MLQAIARVNRLFSDEDQGIDKDLGYIVDYAGVLEDLDSAMDTYSEGWQGFDKKDLEQAIANIQTEIDKLPQVHANLRKIFEPITNTRDETEYEDLLVDDEALRDDFYERLSQFSKVFAIALSSERFITDTPERKINSYRQDLKRFQNLKAAVKLRCADDLDTRDLEPKIKKLLDTHISASEVTTLTGPVNIFDENAFNSALDRQPTLRAKADTIRTNTQRVITAKYDEDPAFYQKLSELLQAAIDAFREKRISELEYLQQTENVRNNVVYHRNDDAPEELNGDEDAIAFFGVIRRILTETSIDPAQVQQANIDAAQQTLKIIRDQVVRDWYRVAEHPNQKFMANEIDDYIYDVLEEKYEVNLDETTKDRMINELIQLAKNRPNLRY
ncbi:MAG: type I restriction enzyme endonuclease domain-containing protein [Cyanobacteria bacterium J06597_16]